MPVSGVSNSDRWQIEGNHREEKDTLGVGQAQLPSPCPNNRLGGGCLQCAVAGVPTSFRRECGEAYAQLPKWRRNARRPSCLDLITLLRKDNDAAAPVTRSLRVSNHPSGLGPRCCRLRKC